MKKVLVPTDFSDNAWDALIYAIRLYDDIPCCFYILNTYPISKTSSEKELKKISNYLNDNFLNNKHTYIIMSKKGLLLANIKQIVSNKNIDIIIMGTTGATGIKEVFMGSNTVKTIKHIDLCPIISVPLKYEYEEPEQLVLATNFKRHFNTIELESLIELQLIHNFEISILHVIKENILDSIQQQNKKALKQFLDNDNTVFEEIITYTTIADAINNYTEEYKVNMVCLLNYEHSFIEKLTHEPIIKKISFHSTIPLLILPV
ncbi:MAG: universal stress protein [Flavobacteriaceae bacterium]|nr:universal stress protein [Flavobacteriaceae bacterium]